MLGALEQVRAARRRAAPRHGGLRARVRGAPCRRCRRRSSSRRAVAGRGRNALSPPCRWGSGLDSIDAHVDFIARLHERGRNTVRPAELSDSATIHRREVHRLERRPNALTHWFDDRDDHGYRPFRRREFHRASRRRFASGVGCAPQRVARRPDRRQHACPGLVLHVTRVPCARGREAVEARLAAGLPRGGDRRGRRLPRLRDRRSVVPRRAHRRRRSRRTATPACTAAACCARPTARAPRTCAARSTAGRGTSTAR